MIIQIPWDLCALATLIKVYCFIKDQNPNVKDKCICLCSQHLSRITAIKTFQLVCVKKSNVEKKWSLSDRLGIPRVDLWTFDKWKQSRYYFQFQSSRYLEYKVWLWNRATGLLQTYFARLNDPAELNQWRKNYIPDTEKHSKLKFTFLIMSSVLWTRY